MTMHQLTIKAQEAVQKAQQLALELEHQAIDTGHLLIGILLVDEHVTPFILKKLGVASSAFHQGLEKIVESYGKVKDASPYLTREANEVLQRAQIAMKSMKDDFVSIEHILVGLTKGKHAVAKMLNDLGIHEKAILKAIEDLRKGSKVTSQSAEANYNALSKYAIHLNERAENGKLDPVIDGMKRFAGCCIFWHDEPKTIRS